MRFRTFTNGQLSQETTFVNCDSQICDERAPSGLIRRAFYGLGISDAGSFVFLFYDHVGSVRHTTSHLGEQISSIEFDPFGRELATSGPPIPLRGFAQLNQLSGLSFGTFREYAPELGRWLRQDPIGLLDSRDAPPCTPPKMLRARCRA